MDIAPSSANAIAQMKSGPILGSAVIGEAFFGRKQAAMGTLFGSVSHSPNREAKLTLATPWTPTATQGLRNAHRDLRDKAGTYSASCFAGTAPRVTSIFVDEAGCFHLITIFLSHV